MIMNIISIFAVAATAIVVGKIIVDKLADRLASKIGNNGPIYLQVDGRTLGEVAIDNINAITRQNNRFALNLV